MLCLDALSVEDARDTKQVGELALAKDKLRIADMNMNAYLDDTIGRSACKPVSERNAKLVRYF